jgi:hypothetical protein
MNYPLSHDCLRRDLIQALLWVKKYTPLDFPRNGNSKIAYLAAVQN